MNECSESSPNRIARGASWGVIVTGCLEVVVTDTYRVVTIVLVRTTMRK